MENLTQTELKILYNIVGAEYFKLLNLKSSKANTEKSTVINTILYKIQKSINKQLS